MFRFVTQEPSNRSLPFFHCCTIKHHYTNFPSYLDFHKMRDVPGFCSAGHNYQIFQETRVYKQIEDLYKVIRKNRVQVRRTIDNFVQVPIYPTGSCHSAQQLVVSSLSFYACMYIYTKATMINIIVTQAIVHANFPLHNSSYNNGHVTVLFFPWECAYTFVTSVSCRFFDTCDPAVPFSP